MVDKELTDVTNMVAYTMKRLFKAVLFTFIFTICAFIFFSWKVGLITLGAGSFGVVILYAIANHYTRKQDKLREKYETKQPEATKTEDIDEYFEEGDSPSHAFLTNQLNENELCLLVEKNSVYTIGSYPKSIELIDEEGKTFIKVVVSGMNKRTMKPYYMNRFFDVTNRSDSAIAIQRVKEKLKIAN